MTIPIIISISITIRILIIIIIMMVTIIIIIFGGNRGVRGRANAGRPRVNGNIFLR